MTELSNVKVKSVLRESGQGGFQAYRNLCYGNVSTGYVLWAEAVFSLLGPMPGAAGIFLRSRFYPRLFDACAGRLLVGRNVTFRHPRKIRFGRNVIIDDGSLIDAKGQTNQGIRIEDDVFIGRQSIIYCKNGDIRLKKGVNISSNCTVFSSNALTIGEGTVIGAYSYLLSGGEYDYRDPTPFSEQSGMKTGGELTIGSNGWLGARVTVLDAACIGNHCVIGAGSVVTKPIPHDSLAVGTPAKVVRNL